MINFYPYLSSCFRSHANLLFRLNISSCVHSQRNLLFLLNIFSCVHPRQTCCSYWTFPHVFVPGKPAVPTEHHEDPAQQTPGGELQRGAADQVGSFCWKQSSKELMLQIHIAIFINIIITILGIEPPACCTRDGQYHWNYLHAVQEMVNTTGTTCMLYKRWSIPLEPPACCTRDMVNTTGITISWKMSHV